MNWLIENWFIVVGIIALVAVVIFALIKFYNLPTEEQIKKVKEWLLFAVVEAEKQLGEKTGQIKLRKVYDMFVERFPMIAKVIKFETFSTWVDEALEKMKKMLESNKSLQIYITN